MDGAGNLYGAAETGGITGHGTVFELTPNGVGGWTETVLYNIGVNVLDGIQPLGGVVFDSQGNLYGTTSSGGSLGYGVIYKLSPTANGWTETGLYPFNGVNGENPNATLIVDSADNVYGTTAYGGPHSKGVVFELVGGEIRLLHGFTGLGDGAGPLSTLALDKAGRIYGTTTTGGGDDAGVVFQLTLVNGIWKESVLYSFTRGVGIGDCPVGGVILDSQENLYGTTYRNGAAGTNGGVFKLTRISSRKWSYSILYAFQGPTDGNMPGASLVFDTTGNLYGTTQLGGNRRLGTVFELSPTASGQWDEAFLYSFQGGRDGANPITTALVLDALGNVYGTTAYGGTADTGVVFEITP